MEQNQNQNQGSSLFQLNIDMNANMTLRSAASWAKVLGVVGMILGILFVILGVLVQNAASSGRMGLGSSGSAIGSYGLVVYLIMGLVLIISSVFALNFGNKISAALRANDQNSLSQGFGGVRNYFALWSIICIIFLLLVLFAVLGTLGR